MKLGFKKVKSFFLNWVKTMKYMGIGILIFMSITFLSFLLKYPDIFSFNGLMFLAECTWRFEWFRVGFVRLLIYGMFLWIPLGFRSIFTYVIAYFVGLAFTKFVKMREKKLRIKHVLMSVINHTKIAWKSKKKLLVFLFLFLMLLNFYSVGFLVEAGTSMSKGDITFQPNVIPELEIHFVEEFFRFKWRENRFDLKLLIHCEGKNHSLRDFWEKTDRVMNWENMSRKATDSMYEFGYTISDIPQEIADNVEFLVWKIEGASFDVSEIELEEIEVFDIWETGEPLEHPYNITRFHLPDNLVLSYEDLWLYDFTVSHPNKFETTVKGVKGKTSWNLDPITFSGDIITCVGETGAGDTEANAYDFEDLYNSDKAGERELMANATAVQNMNLTTQIKPTDEKALKLRLVISGFVSNGFINITGTDKDDVAQTETDIAITGDGNYSTSLWFRTVDTNGFDCNGSYGVAVYQLQWGVVWKTSDTQYTFDANIQIGDGSTTTWFKDIDKEIFISDVVSYRSIKVKRYGHFYLGQVDDESKHITSHGCTIIDDVPASGNLVVYGDSSGSDIRLYSSTIRFTGYLIFGTPHGFVVSYGLAYVWNSIFDGVGFGREFDAYNVRVTNVIYGSNPLYGANVERIYIENVWRGIQTVGTQSVTLRNSEFQNCLEYTFFIREITTDKYLINVVSDDWNFEWYLTSTAKVYRQYEFDLTFTFDNGSYTEGTNVTISNSYLGTSDSWILTANGSIPQQTYSMGHYNQTGGDTIYDYNPYNITATLDGYQTYTTLINVTKKEDLTIALSELPSPVARFTYSPSNPEPSETITFNATESISYDGIASYFWNFGDGANATGVTTTHSYSSAGNYPVSLTVTDNQNLNDTVTHTITVKALPPPPPPPVYYAPAKQYDLTMLVKDQYRYPIESVDVEVYLKTKLILTGKTDEYGAFIAKRQIEKKTYLVRVTYENRTQETTVLLDRDKTVTFEYALITFDIFVMMFERNWILVVLVVVVGGMLTLRWKRAWAILLILVSLAVIFYADYNMFPLQFKLFFITIAMGAGALMVKACAKT